MKRIWLSGVVVLIACMTLGAAARRGIWEERVTTKKLGGKDRALLYVSTDKPIYREGETLYLRAVALKATDNTPVEGGQFSVQVKVRGPKGDIVHRSYGHGRDSSAGIGWKIPAGTPGGRYTAVVSSPTLGTPETERFFDIRAYRAPRLKTQIEFLREGYGPGDKVQATVVATRAEGGFPVGSKVTVIARVDGKEVFNKSGFKVGTDGVCSAAFVLPDRIEVGDGTLSFVIEDGGVLETASKTIPIILQSMDLAFYPEGGDLIAGLANRVYVQAKRPDGKPADIAGRIVEQAGKKTVAKLTTAHEGRGVFNFIPKAGVKYALLLDAPAGISKEFPLPLVKQDGAVVKSLQQVYPYAGKLAVAVSSTVDSRAAKVTLAKREVELDTQKIAAGKDVSVSLDAKDSEGVLIVTVWDADGCPLAERLVYRKPRFGLTVKLSTEQKSFTPGGKVTLNVETVDENGRPVEAVVGLTVTDDSVLEMIEKREQAPRLPVMVGLENDVRDLADAHVYLDDKNPEAPESLDLLLGTQGWRRFILVRYDELKKRMPKAARRALAERLIQAKHLRFKRKGLGAGLRGQVVDAIMPANADVAEAEGGVDDKEVLMPIKPAAVAAELVEEIDHEYEAGEEKEEDVFDLKDELMKRDVAKIRVEEMPLDERLAKKRRWVVREYAHKVRANRKPNDRVDFTETLYWHAGLRTSARDGKASVSFALSDSVTSFRVMADGFARNGALGADNLLIESVQPFSVEPKMPLEVTVGDKLQIPVALINATAKNLAVVNLLVRGGGKGVSVKQVAPGKVAAGARVRRLVEITPLAPGKYPLVFSGAAGSFTDTVTRTLVVKPRGFPVEVQHGGLLAADKPFATSITLPQALEPGSVTAKAMVFPTPLANMEEALNALLRQPYGCFEQTSSTNYPLVMAQQYFLSHQGIAPDKIAKAKKLLDAGLKKLTGFECRKKGYEWFGSDPGHEALTAYGLMEFVDMAKVMPVDKKMINRTRKWLLARRDGQGGFKRNQRALDSFGGAPAPTTNAYIVWALLESGEDPATLQQEIAAVKAEALKSKDSYVVALAANILYLAKDKPAAVKLATKLADALQADGQVAAAVTSITQSGGEALAIETTSLAILAWLKDDARWAAKVEQAMKWLFARCKAGRFGSTQSTILALKAINAYDQARAKPKQPGKVQLMVNGQPFGQPVEFGADSKGAIELPDFAAALTAGKHRLELRMEDGSQMPFALEVRYHTSLPASSEECTLNLQTKLSNAKVSEGSPLEMMVEVTALKKDAPTPIAIIGLPGGCEVRHDQLKELVAAGRISSYEVIGREVVLYWRVLKSGKTCKVPLSLTAVIPGTSTAPASRAYLYYTDEHRVWIAGKVQ